ncbi:MAG: SPOR domain-containing protein [Bacteroides sp.]|nr:SPOR domain-containing protein [Bacteroides sp.]MCM1389239.1 SPOR domain-containing protein [Bacteroides sp.]
MKRIILISCFAAIMWAATGCKTTEANYRAAYEVAKEKSAEKSPVDGTIYDQMRREAIDSRLIVDGDSIPMVTAQIATVPGYSTPQDVKRYSVVINQFKQVFNAKSQVDRLRASGYSGALLVVTAEPLYYVVAAGADSAEEAAVLFKKVSDDKSIVKKSPFPWVLRPAIYPLK